MAATNVQETRDDAGTISLWEMDGPTILDNGGEHDPDELADRGVIVIPGRRESGEPGIQLAP